MKRPTLSIVLGTKDRPIDVRRLIDSIDWTVPDNLTYEIVISDASQHPIEDEPITVDAMWPRIRILPERPPIGCTRGYNAAFRAATGRFCLWVNDDCEFEDGCIEKSVAFMKAHPEIGIGAISYAEPARMNYHINGYFGMPYANFGIIPRTFGNDIGWFDEDFPMYGNDNSLTFRCLLGGRGIAAVPDAKIFHRVTWDLHRQMNNDQQTRIADGERLIAKYRPHREMMQATYRKFATASNSFNDQTPHLTGLSQ